MIKKKAVTEMESNSATTTDNQIPSNLSHNGKKRMERIWNKNVLEREIAADTPPLFNAVKKDEPSTLKPMTRKEREYSINPLVVILSSASSYPTKIFASGYAKTSASKVIKKADAAIMVKLFFLRLLISSVLPAP